MKSNLLLAGLAAAILAGAPVLATAQSQTDDPETYGSSSPEPSIPDDGPSGEDNGSGGDSGGNDGGVGNDGPDGEGHGGGAE